MTRGLSGGVPTVRWAARRVRQECGLTLIELLVVVLLIGVGLMSLAAMTTTVSRANTRSASLSAASALAEERLESLRGQPSVTWAPGSDSRMLDGVTYGRSWSVAPDDPLPGLERITVMVTWSSRGATRRATLSTIRGSR
jgi:prepilin-type N-terminal cleavage/methylation domain-containing protein